MTTVPRDFEFRYNSMKILYGRKIIAKLGKIIAQHGLERALIISGSNVAANDDLMDPIKKGLGNRLVGIFDETTPAKRVETAYDAIDRMRKVQADVLIGVGGGSSLDIARQMSVLAADGRGESEIKQAAHEGIPIDINVEAPAKPTIVIPTTFAGADVSWSGSVVVLPPEKSPSGQPITLSATAIPIMDIADPAAFETSPVSVLEGSAMNGYNKGIETLYARDRNPFTDLTATRGLEYLSNSIPKISKGNRAAFDRAVLGMLLVQYERKASLMHAFGHAFARRYPIQQGHVHAVMAPYVLRYILERLPKFKPKFIKSLAIDAQSKGELTNAIIENVVRIRDSLDVPTRVGDLPETRREDIPALAKFVLNDRMISQLPVSINLTEDDIKTILSDAW